MATVVDQGNLVTTAHLIVPQTAQTVQETMKQTNKQNNSSPSARILAPSTLAKKTLDGKLPKLDYMSGGLSW